MSTLLEKIQELRIEKGIKSIRKLEEISGITKDTMRDWDDVSPRCANLIKVAEVFDVSMDYLMERTNNRNSHKSIENPNILNLIAVAQEYEIDENITKVLIYMIKAMSED